MVGRDPDEAHRTSTPLELLFDLTFVVAVARAASELHHALGQGHGGHTLAGYAAVFFGLWWAWVNFTWFASAYDTDDVAYRLLTLLQMTGVLVYAAGIPAAFEHFDFTTVVAGYVIMRLALVTQWLRAARAHPEGRAGTLRYAIGVSVVQLGWIGRLWLSGVASLVVLVAAELAVPAWAEFTGRATPWHPDHIGERYGLFTIIVLGEVVSAIATAVQSALGHSGASLSLLTAAAGLLLVFALWWSYFTHSATEHIRQSLPWTFVWALAHYLIFAAVAAIGAGLQVVIDSLGHLARRTPLFAAVTVAIPVTVFLVVLGLLNHRMSNVPASLGLTLLTAVLVLAAGALTPLLTLPLSIVIMMTLVVLLLAYHLRAAHQPTCHPGQQPPQ
ncbi:MAG: low temperature requirement protein A [Pseudonocardiales bacterium]|nr:low temperature requirement protein A [Pseudonocardiales bacterium]